ncbi:MAG: type II toxin-antitoxin system HicB family antitoxin [Chloroflexota bacterium]|nr:type II toxin-antitoxin system HicB family antitoxin [Chloroflexota bacterium]
MEYLVIFEEGARNFSAYSPDLPGCVAVGEDFDETLHEMEAAIRFHIEGLRENHLEVPEPRTRAQYITAVA